LFVITMFPLSFPQKIYFYQYLFFNVQLLIIHYQLSIINWILLYYFISLSFNMSKIVI